MRQMISKDKQKLIYIRWQDASHVASWMTPDQLENSINREMLIIEQIGWIVYEDKKEIHIVSRRCLDSIVGSVEYGMYQRIPKAWILKKKVMVK